MGLSDLASGFADAVTDGVSSIASAPSKAISFAKGVADKAEGFVEQTVGPKGMAVIHTAADLIPNPFGVLSAGVSALTDALADPLGFVMGIVDKAESTGLAALHFAENSIGALVRTSLGGINVLLQGSLGVVKLLARGAVSSFRMVAKDFVTSFMFALSGLRAAGMGLLRFEGKMTKAAFQLAANINKTLIHSWKQRIRDLIVTTGTKIQNATRAITEPVTRRATELSQSLHRKATFIVVRVLPTALAITGQVMVAANKANQAVQSAIKKAAPFVPAGLSFVTQRIGNFTKNLADKSTKLFLFVGVKLTPAVMRAYVALETQVIPMINQVAATANQIQVEVFDQVNTRGVQALFFLDRIERQLDEKIDAVTKTLQGKVDFGIETLDSTLGAALTQANQIGTQAAQGAGDFVAGLEQKGEAAADDAVQDVKKATTPNPDGSIPIVKSAKAFAGRVGEAALNFAGDVGRGAIEFGGRLLDPATRFGQARQPHDGELTGPFFPGTPMANENQVAGLHGQGTSAEREGAIASGANIFVNGIDTTLADHYRAAQRLANTLNVTVVGVYNASGGMGTDLVQCAADKFFDRSGNPAVATMSRLIRTYGDARKPNGGMHIFAHSQGSLIVSEALRQAQRTGADLRGNDVTTFGNAAFTYPAGPQYHHYIHDDDAVSGSVGTGSLISNLMNNTGIGRALSGAFLGPTADVQATTVTLHHGGGGIEPHAVNAPSGQDYIGDLGAFRAQEARQMPIARRTPVWQRSMEASGFALARAAGNAATGAVASRYGALDTGIRSLPSLPGLPPNSLWNMADRGLRSFGGAITGFGAALGASNDASFSGLSNVQRSGFAAKKSPEEEHKTVTNLKTHADPGFAPDMGIREKLMPHLGFDPGGARFHSGPPAAAAARSLGAHAFTMGQDVYFGSGEYDPASSKGMGLIAHELTHVAQQAGMSDHLPRYSRDVGSTGDTMEAEAQQVATRVMANAGSRAGLNVEQFYKVYEAEEGVGRDDARRLDRIGDAAIRKAQEMLGSKSGIVDQVSVSIELDLGRMSDDEAAEIWAVAIVAQVNLAPQRPLPTVPAPGLVQKADTTRTADGKLRSLPKDVETAIEDDVAAITEQMKAWFPEWKVVYDAFHRWWLLDIETPDKYSSKTKHMDYFLARLSISSFDKGLVSTQSVSALDEALRRDPWLWRYLKDDSELYKTYKTGGEAESAGSYVGRHTLMGVLGIIKALGTAIMGLVQGAIWLDWKTSGWKRKTIAYGLEKAGKATGSDVKALVEFFRSDDPPSAKDYVMKCFEDTIRIIINCFDVDEEEKKKMYADFSFADKWGAIPANLMLLGAGGGGVTSEGAQVLLKGLMIAQTVEGIDTATKALYARVDEILKKNPNATWWDVMSDGQVLQQFTTIVVSAVALGTNMAEASEKTKALLSVLQKAGYVLDWAQLGPPLKRAWDDYHDTSIDEKKRKEMLEQDAIDFINQVITVGNSTKGKIEHERAQAAKEELQRQKDEAYKQKAAQDGPAPTPEQIKQQQDAAWAQREAEKKSQTPTFEESLSPEQKAARDKYLAEQQGPSRAPTPEELKKNPNLISRAEEGAKATAPEERPDPNKKKNEPAVVEEPVAKQAEPAEPSFDKDRAAEAQRKIAEDQAKLNDPTTTDPGYREKLQKRIDKMQRRLASMFEDEAAAKSTPAGEAAHDAGHAPAKELAPESQAAIPVIAAGGKQGVAAAIEMIKREGAWKAKLREAVGEKGAFGPEATRTQKEGVKDAVPERIKEIGAVFDEARAQIINEAAAKVRNENPKVAALIGTEPQGQANRAGLFEAGTPGFKSDRDITARPKQEHIDALLKFDERAKAAKTPEEKAQIMREKAQRVSELVNASGEMVRLMNKELADSTHGIPDKTLDTNMYSWTGSEITFDLPPTEAKAVNVGTDVASQAELHQRMSPEDWAAHKKRLIEGTEEYRGVDGPEMKKRLLEKLAQAEAVSGDLNKRIEEQKAQVKKKKGGESDQAIEMEAKANVAFELNQKLVELLKSSPVPYGEVASIQSQIKILEPGAYGSQAGIKDVVLTQQPMSRDYDNYKEATKALDELQKDPSAKKEQIAEAYAKVRQAEEAARQRYLSGQDLTPREMAQSAASTLAQLEDHNPAKHPPQTENEALTAIKDAYKYTGRIEFLEYLMTGKTVETPDVANFSRDQLKDLVQTWAVESGKVPRGTPPDKMPPLTQLALDYANARVDKCRDTVARLELESEAHDIASEKAPPPTPANEPQAQAEPDRRRIPLPGEEKKPITTGVVNRPFQPPADDDDEKKKKK